MPMFPTPSPRQFHYKPRFYDPDKEEWELTKLKYGYKEDPVTHKRIVEEPVSDDRGSEAETSSTIDASSEVEYFDNLLKRMDEDERKAQSKLTLSDLFRKRKMPTFNYQPRFSGDQSVKDENGDVKQIYPQGQEIMERMRRRKISRRFDMEDTEYFKPVPAGKIMIYVLLVFALIWWVLMP